MKNSIASIKKLHPYIETKVKLFFYRRKAHRLIKRLVNSRGYKIVDRKKTRMLKSYAQKNFGSTSFWPWLSLYTEIRGEFKPGWIPNDYYMAHLIKEYNPESIRISNYKTFDNKMFPDFALKPLVLKIGNIFYNGDRRQISMGQAEKVLSNYNKEVVLKEDLEFGGHKVMFMQSRKLNFDKYSHISSYIIQPVVDQHKDLSTLNSKALSTVRVLTYLNEEGTVEVKYAYFRFGIGKSRVDNTTSGGGFCYVNPDGSLVGKAYGKLGIEMGEKHPDSGTLFKSVSIPNYEKVLQECIKSHKIFPYFKFIGWDVAVNKSGVPVLLEWNSEPLIWMAEALYGPFFKKEITENGLANLE